jgi:DNA-directed RNA polymerase
MKHASTNMAAHKAAKVLGALNELSHKSTVVLFAALVMEERLNPHSDVAKELQTLGFTNYYGQLTPEVMNHYGECIEMMVANCGTNLGPMAEPTSLVDLGHSKVKGKSTTSPLVEKAELYMRSTGYTLDRRVIALANMDVDKLSREQRVSLAVLMSTALPETFYFPVSYDYRGRMYYRGGLVTPQGDDLMKGCLRFAEEAPLGKHGLAAIHMAFADAMGWKVAKVAVAAKIEATDLIAEGLGSHGYQAAGLAMEIQHIGLWVQEGNALEDFMSGIVCHQDATCSGLQIAAAITGDRATAHATNCTASSKMDERECVYQDVTDIVATSSTPLGALARKYGRGMLKFAVMTLGYGAGKSTLKLTVVEFILKQNNLKFIKSRKMDAAQNLEVAMTLLARTPEMIDWEVEEDVLMEALDAKCGATICLMETLKQVSDLASMDSDSVEWTTQDGFHCVQEKQSGDVVEVGKFSMEFDTKMDTDLQSQAIAPNVVHSLDAAQMREAIRELRGKPVAAVHDSLGTRPCDYWNAGIQVRKAFVRIDARTTVQALCDEHGVILPLLGTYKPEEAAKSAYFWC